MLRLITGAKARQRRIAEAIAAGGVRRGYLKGLGETFGCAVPAAPVHGLPETPPLRQPTSAIRTGPRGGCAPPG